MSRIVNLTKRQKLDHIHILQKGLELTFGMNVRKVDRKQAIVLLQEYLKNKSVENYPLDSPVHVMNVLLGYLLAYQCFWKQPQIEKSMKLWKKSKIVESCYYQAVAMKNNFKQINILELEQKSKQNNAWCQFMLAECYQFGYNVIADINKAIYWHQHSAQLGHCVSQNNLGVLWDQGKKGTERY